MRKRGLLIGFVVAIAAPALAGPNDMGIPGTPPQSQPERERIKKKVRDGDDAQGDTARRKEKEREHNEPKPKEPPSSREVDR
jgi:hypothetical protein